MVQEMPQDFVAVARTAELQPGQTRRVLVAGHPVLVANVAGTFFAVDDTCTHEDASLSLGCLKGELVSCTLHGSRCSVVTEEPATGALRTWPVCIEHDTLYIGVRPA